MADEVESSDHGHFVSVEHAGTNEVFHFVVGKQGFRFIGRVPRTGGVPSQSSVAYAAAEAMAARHFRELGLL